MLLYIKASLCTHWANGGEGTKDLATHVVDLCKKDQTKFKFLYESKTPLFKKIEVIAKEIYRADEVIADTKIRDQLKSFEDSGYGDLPICIAKTQYSFSTDPIGSVEKLYCVLAIQIGKSPYPESSKLFS